MLELIQWLLENIPAEDASPGSRTGIVHGDFRLDNLVFHPTEVSLRLLKNKRLLLGLLMTGVKCSFFSCSYFSAIFSLAFVRMVPTACWQVVLDSVITQGKGFQLNLE